MNKSQKGALSLAELIISPCVFIIYFQKAYSDQKSNFEKFLHYQFLSTLIARNVLQN